MIETILSSPLISGLVLAFLSGLGWLAIKHYDVYIGIGNNILTVSTYTIALFWTWNICTGFISYRISIDLKEIGIEFDPTRYYIVDHFWILSYIVVAVYLSTLNYIGKRINKKKKKEK